MNFVILILWTIGTANSPHGTATDRTWRAMPDMNSCRLEAKLQMTDPKNGALCVNVIATKDQAS
jgi:hypothetical protein